jgi:hypothetical protein
MTVLAIPLLLLTCAMMFPPFWLLGIAIIGEITGWYRIEDYMSNPT